MFLFHDNKAARPHFIHEFLIDVLLDNTLAEFLAKRLQMFFGEAFAGDAKGGFAPRVARERDRHSFASDRNPLVAAEGIGHDFTSLNFELNTAALFLLRFHRACAHGLRGDLIAQ